jgi:hypothetical protein
MLHHPLAHRVPWLVLALAAIGLAFWLGSRARPTSPGVDRAPGELVQRVEELEGALELERAAREALAQELAELHLHTDMITEQLGFGLGIGRSDAEAQLPTDPGPQGTAEAASSAERPEAAAPLFDVESLVATCMPRSDAEALRARWERHELERIQLNDTARRENYFMRPRHRLEHLALEVAFRSEVGEADYDAYLRATGKPNRVEVKAVLPEGEGSAAGLEVGDELERYADVRVFSVGNLHGLTAAGRLGETVSVEILRDGQLLTLRIPRGPLGVVLEPMKKAPTGDCARS